MLERIRNAVSFAAEHGITVAYFGVDGTRADLEFFRQAYETAIEAGAKEAVVVDTIGIATPEAVADLVGRTREWLGAGRPGALPRPQRLRARHRGGRGRRPRRRDLGAGDDQRHGRARRQRQPDRGRAHARRALRRLDEPAPRSRPRGLAPRRRGRRHAARGVEAGRRREPLPPRERRGREPVPRPAGDRAVLVRARRRRALGRARQEERDRLDPARGRAARARRPRGAVARPAREGQGARRARSAASSPTTSSGRSL